MDITGLGVRNEYQRNVPAKRQDGNTSFQNYISGGKKPAQPESASRGASEIYYELYSRNTVNVQNPNKAEYAEYSTENYRIVPDNEAGCFDIYNKQGERLGAFDYSDIKVKQDAATGTQLLISEHGTMSYDALVLDGELKTALADVMGKENLEVESLQGFQITRHSGTGISVLVKDTEIGRGGKVLLQTEADRQKYEALAEEYLNKYPNLVSDKNAAYIRADLEIRGLMERTKDGIISLGWNGVSYSDNADYKKNWSMLFSAGGYESLYEWLHQSAHRNEESQSISSWIKVLDGIGSRHERIWSDEEEKQGYLNN